MFETWRPHTEAAHGVPDCASLPDLTPFPNFWVEFPLNKSTKEPTVLSYETYFVIIRLRYVIQAVSEMQ